MRIKKKWLGMVTLIVGVILVFALSGCPNGGESGETWEQANIDPITGTRSDNNTISFTYNGGQGTITRDSGGETLDGVWNGTFDGDTIRITVSGSNWTMAILDNGSYVDTAKGTTEVSGTTVTIIVTHIMSNGSIDLRPGPGPEPLPPPPQPDN